MRSRAQSHGAFERGGREEPAHSDLLKDRRPAAHAEQQFEGMFAGLGATSKEPVSGKRNSAIKRIHFATHYAVGCEQWDDPAARGPSQSQVAHSDPGVVYCTRPAPDKNRSLVEMNQIAHVPSVHYRTEQSIRFEDPGPQPRDAQIRPKGTLHFGDHQSDMVTQTCATHFQPPDAEARRGQALRLAGVGALQPNSAFTKPNRGNPITAGPRSLDNYDLGVMNDLNFGKMTANHSRIILDHSVRNPIMGHNVPISTYDDHARFAGFKRTQELIAEGNARVPPLYSLAAVRPGEA